MNVLNLFRRPAKNASDIRQKLAELNDALPALAAEARAATQKRSAGLLTATDAEIEKLEASMLRASRDHDRALAAVAELERLALEAEEAERRKLLDDDIARVNKQADAIAKKLRDRYEPVAGELVDMLTELQAAEAEIQRVRWLLVDAQRGGETPMTAEERAFALGPLVSLEQAGLPAITSIRPAGSCLGWGPAAQIASTFSLKG